MEFQLTSEFKPTGDQPEAIAALVEGLQQKVPYQTLLGVTGSGKTFTIANVINQINKPTLVLSHNKTLAAQLYSEFKSFFPNNAVEYFVSYYDYYQPEAYLPTTDTYIEKDLSINDEIEKLRLAATSSLLSGRKDVIVISSVSCLYGIGNPEDFQKTTVDVRIGQKIERDKFLRLLVNSLYSRNETAEFDRGNFRVKGDTDMNPMLHERKWEIDSLAYPIRLAYNYWKTTGDTSVFDADWTKAMNLVVKTFREQQRKDGNGPYKFQRKTERQLDTLNNDGWGNPVNPVGLIVSSFRPSDDATTFQFLVPSNLFAVTSLRQVAEIAQKVTNDKELAAKCTELADEVEEAIRKYAIVEHPKYGKVYAFEVDGFGNAYFMDDANVPSLLAMPYLDTIDVNDPIYQNTRKLVLSEDNPYFFRGTAGEGIGGPHIGYDMIWPMSIIMRAKTSNSDEEIKHCLRMLRDTDANTGFMHESFHKDDPAKFTRSWFAWVNTLFGELIVNLESKNRMDLVNSL
jgi:meiotically up-regulated gene 157 (Mug157) protein